MEIIKRLFARRRAPENTPPPEQPKPPRKEKTLAGYFRKKNGEFPFGDGFDKTAAIRQIFPRTTDSIVSCDTGRSIGEYTDGSRAYATDTEADKVREESAPSFKRYSPLDYYGINEKVLRHFQTRAFIGWNACAIIAQHELISRACSIPAEDAMAPGYTVSYLDKNIVGDGQHDGKDIDFLVKIKRAADDMGMNELCVKYCYNKKVFGVGIAIPCMSKSVDMEKPYNPDGVKKGTYHGFSVVDPYWIRYDFDDSAVSDAASKDFYVPTYYCLPNGRRVHKSWVFRAINCHVPDVLKPTYYFGGLPLTQMMYERVFCGDKIANEAPMLAMTKRLLIADANVEQMVADPRHANLMMKAINYFRDNFSVFFKKPNSQVTQLDTNIADLPPLTASQYQLASAIAQIPVTKLMKNVPTGLQATGQYEWKDYSQSLLAIQEEYTPLLNRHFELYCRSNYPDRKDIRLEITFNDIDVPTKLENAQVESQYSNIIGSLIGSGVITVREARDVLRAEHGGIFSNISSTVPELLQKREDAKDPAKQQGGMPGMPGMPGMGGPAGGEGGSQDAPQTMPEPFANAVRKVSELRAKLGEEGGEGGGDATEAAPAPTDTPPQDTPYDAAAEKLQAFKDLLTRKAAGQPS